VIDTKQQDEDQQVEAEKAVYPVDEVNTRDFRIEPGEQRHGQQHDDEGGGEQPLQVVQPAGDTHRLADRPQHEVTGEQAEEQGEAGQNGRQLFTFGIDRPRHAPGERLHLRRTAR
jgi:hypothetical protein